MTNPATDKNTADFNAAFKGLEKAVETLAAPLEQSPLAQSALHIERSGQTDYTLINREYFELLEAKAAAWDEAQRDPAAEASEEAALLAAMKTGS